MKSFIRFVLEQDNSRIAKELSKRIYDFLYKNSYEDSSGDDYIVFTGSNWRGDQIGREIADDIGYFVLSIVKIIRKTTKKYTVLDKKTYETKMSELRTFVNDEMTRLSESTTFLVNSDWDGADDYRSYDAIDLDKNGERIVKSITDWVEKNLY